MEKKFKTFKERKEHLLWTIKFYQKELLEDMRLEQRYSVEYDLRNMKVAYNVYRNMIIMEYGSFNSLWLI